MAQSLSKISDEEIDRVIAVLGAGIVPPPEECQRIARWIAVARSRDLERDELVAEMADELYNTWQEEAWRMPAAQEKDYLTWIEHRNTDDG